MDVLMLWKGGGDQVHPDASPDADAAWVTATGAEVLRKILPTRPANEWTSLVGPHPEEPDGPHGDRWHFLVTRDGRYVKRVHEGYSIPGGHWGSWFPFEILHPVHVDGLAELRELRLEPLIDTSRREVDWRKYGAPVDLLSGAYIAWCEQYRAGWGLAWYLAAEVCNRYYASHGIVPHVIAREGLGYYGIQLDRIACSVYGPSAEPIGRFTMAGNVENWTTGSPGDHGLELESTAKGGAKPDALLQQAVRHLGLEPFPSKSHLSCRHKRWGASYQLVFELAALAALRLNNEVAIWNDRAWPDRVAKPLDPDADRTEHLGYFLLEHDGRRMVLAGDGRCLQPKAPSLWERYMRGESKENLLAWLLDTLRTAPSR